MSPTRSLCAALVLAATALPCGAAGPGDIRNFHPIDESLATAGQVAPEQIRDLARADYGLVVNLAVADPERNASEGFRVVQEGLAYAHIPVRWDEPTLEDLDLFFAVMDARGDRRTLVHCFANFRASAFTYLYRVLRLGVPEARARADLEAIWDEEAWAKYPQWAAFLEHARARSAP